MLADAVEEMALAGERVRLLLFGPTDRHEEGFWTEFKKKRIGQPWIVLKDWLTAGERLKAVLESDVYASASLAEGCSNATMTALGLGIPAVMSASGNVPELMEEVDNVVVFRPGDREELAGALRLALSRLRSGAVKVDAEKVLRFRDRHSEARETAKWNDVIAAVVRGS
jgi:glycosyltransferase involved in cell wall biosynthesis